MENKVWRKGLVCGIIALFVGASVVPSLSGTLEKSNSITNGKNIKRNNEPLDNVVKSNQTLQCLPFSDEKSGTPVKCISRSSDRGKDGINQVPFYVDSEMYSLFGKHGTQNIYENIKNTGFNNLISKEKRMTRVINSPEEEWNKTFGSGWGLNVDITSDGGYIIVAANTSNFLCLIKTDAHGSQQWNKTYTVIIEFISFSLPVQQTDDGGYILASSFFKDNRYKTWLLKTDENGNEQWNKTYDNQTWPIGMFPFGAQQTPDGGYILGVSSFYAVGLIKTDANGNEQWNKTHQSINGQDYYLFGHCLQQTTDRGYIITGGAENENIYDAFLLKTYSNGSIQWFKTYGSENDDEGFSVWQTTDEGYAVTGYYNFTMAHPGTESKWLLKTSYDGTEEWNKTFEGRTFQRVGPSNIGFTVQQTFDSGYIISGGYCLIKTDSAGNIQWNKMLAYNDITRDAIFPIWQTEDGGYIGTGFRYYKANDSVDVLLLKLAPEPQPPVTVYVNDDYNETTPGWGYNHFDHIQNGINTVAEKGTVFVFNGTYSETIVIDKMINLSGENKNTTIINGGGMGSSATVDISADSVTIAGFTIQHNEDGICIRDFDNVTLHENIIRNNTFGVRLINSSYSSITNNTISNNDCGVGVFDTSLFAIISNNTFLNNYWGLSIAFSNGYTVRGNSFYNDGMDVWGVIPFQNIVEKNTVNGKPLIYLEEASDMVLDTPGYAGQVLLVNSTNITIRNQELINTSVSIILWNIQNCHIINNTLSANCGSLEVCYANNTTFIQNKIVNIVDFLFCNNSTILRNIISLPFYFYQGKGLGSLHSRWIEGLIILSASSNNTFAENNISGRLWLYSSSRNNHIYHNNFLANAWNAYDENDEYINTWDNGYPSGGNYWNDYNGSDDFSGPKQNLTGSDGIGDTPYNISGGLNKDHYPLMTPWGNHPPYVPSNPYPANGTTNVSLNVICTWTGGDPDPADIVTYDVFFGTTTPPTTKVSTNQSGTSYNPGTMNYHTTYYWKIRAWDNHSASNTSGTWNFTTAVNHPPSAPSKPNPANHAPNVPITADLSWNASIDPDGDPVTYDVYFGTTSPPPKIPPGNQSGTTYDPGTMNYYTKYYWKIVAWDNHSAFNASPLWDFTTETAPQPPTPDLDCQGTLNWTSPKIKPGATVTGSFTVKNIGQAASKLNWEVKSWPSWGTWTFNPSSGANLTPGASVTVQVTVVAPDEKNKQFTGEVKIVNKNNSSDSCIIQASLITPKNKSFVLHFLEQFLERFPVLGRILSSLPFISRLLSLYN